MAEVKNRMVRFVSVSQATVRAGTSSEKIPFLCFHLDFMSGDDDFYFCRLFPLRLVLSVWLFLSLSVLLLWSGRFAWGARRPA